MKGLINNSKIMVTLFLFVCLGANSQLFQSLFKIETGSSSLASSRSIETSSLLPRTMENCELQTTKTKDFHSYEYDIIDNSSLLENDNDEDGDSSYEDDGFVHSYTRLYPQNNNRISFKLNFKTYICTNTNGQTEEKYDYDMGIKAPEGRLNCHSCRFTGVIDIDQTDTLEEIKNKILDDGVRYKINEQYALAKEKKRYKNMADRCEGELINYPDGSTQLREYSNSERGVKRRNECLIRKIGHFKRRDRTKALELYESLEENLSELAQSDEDSDRKEALRLIKRLRRKSRLPADIKVSLNNIAHYTKSTRNADSIDDRFTQKIRSIQSQACSVNQRPSCLNDHYVNTHVNLLQSQRQQWLNYEQHTSMNPRNWRVSEQEDGDSSYEQWRNNLNEYFQKTIQQISTIYSGPENVYGNEFDRDHNPSGGQNSRDYRDRFDHIGQNPDIQPSRQHISNDVGPVPSVFRNSGI